MIRASKFLIALPIFLAACGSTPQDRAITGGGIGAAGGAVVGAVTGLTVLQAALIGTGVGAVIGGLTSPDKLNLGEPFWRQSHGAAPAGAAEKAPGYSKSVANIQRDLTKLGYDPGPVDGIMGPKTRAAIAQFENDQASKVAQPGELGTGLSMSTR